MFTLFGANRINQQFLSVRRLTAVHFLMADSGIVFRFKDFC